MLILFDRILERVLRFYRKSVFKKRINCNHDHFSLVGKVTLINKNITLGKNVCIYPDVMFFGDGPIVIGDNVDIGNGTIIYASKTGGVSIGSNSIIAAHCYIIDCDHGISAYELIRNQSNTVSSVTIGSDVWIAAGSKILKGSHIHNGAVVGALGLVKGEIMENAVVVGIPAKVIKYRK